MTNLMIDAWALGSFGPGMPRTTQDDTRSARVFKWRGTSDAMHRYGFAVLLHILQIHMRAFGYTSSVFMF